MNLTWCTWFRSPLLLGLAGLLAAPFACGGDGERESPEALSADFSNPDLAGGDIVLAEVAGRPITAAYMAHKIRIQFPDAAHEGPDMVRQARETIKRVIHEACYTHLGEERGYDKDPEFLRVMALSRSFVLTNQTTQRAIYDRVEPTEEQLQEFYDENQKRFIITPQTWFHHILLDSEAEARSVRTKLAQGEDFEELARQYSKDVATAKSGGKMAPMTETYMAGSLGKLPEFGKQVLAMEEGEISGPVRSEKGWHIVRIDAVRKERLRPLDEVREEISWRLRTGQAAELSQFLLDSLKLAYHVQVYDDAFDEFLMAQMNDSLLYEEAQQERDAAKRVQYYERILEQYPESEYCPEAHFMIGFVQAEELGDRARAIETFRAFMQKYPEHDLHQSAELMVAELEKAGSEEGGQ